MYHILPYSYNKARELGVEIKPSTRKDKKIDVYKNNNYICSIGKIEMYDYPTYLRDKGVEYAQRRRYLFHKRFKNQTSLASEYAKKILW